MTHYDDTDDFESLIDKAVDTLFVEGATEEEIAAAELEIAARSGFAPKSSAAPSMSNSDQDDLDEAVDSLFITSFQDASQDTTITVTSGDEETDRAIDLAVDTLFVEEPIGSDVPETTILQPEVVRVPVSELNEPAEPIRGEFRPSEPLSQPAFPSGRSGRPASRGTTPTAHEEGKMTLEIERHMDALFSDHLPRQADRRAPAPAVPSAEAAPPRAKPMAARQAKAALKDLQQAILTLEWEISRRSVKALADQLKNVRREFEENVTVGFAALSMRVVLDYVVKRMSRAHPESIRFLLEVADFLDKSVMLSEQDPLKAFHHILTRYEKYKSLVRRAEGLPDPRPTILDELKIRDPKAFSKIVEAQAKMLMRAGYSLARALGSTDEPENLIRSFRFLVNQSANRILEQTHANSREKGPPAEGRNRGGRKGSG